MQTEQMTISAYFKMYFKSLIAAYTGKRLFTTIGISLLSGILGFAITVYVLPWAFSASSVGNQVYAGLTVALLVMLALGVVMGVTRKNSDYFKNIGAGAVLLMSGYFSKETPFAERLWVIGAAIAGTAAGVFLSPAFTVILAIWLFLDVAQQNSTVLTLAAAVQNSFNNKFRKNHKRNAKATQTNALSLAFGLFVGFVLRLILGFAGVM